MEESNIESNIEVAKPPVFNGETSKVGEFITVCKLYLRMRETTVEEQIQWVLSYVQKVFTKMDLRWGYNNVYE